MHGTTGEAPLARFLREEAAALRPLGGRPPFRQARELARRVQSDACVEVDTNHHGVPWRLIGAHACVEVGGGEVRISHAGAVVARHAERLGRRERAVLPAHLQGVLAAAACGGTAAAPSAAPSAARTPAPAPDLLRPLAEYENAAGGGW